MGELALSIPEAAKLLGISHSMAYHRFHGGEIPGMFALGRRTLVSRKVLEEWVEAQGRKDEAWIG